jgi:uncharacterized protein with HEPN domain
MRSDLERIKDMLESLENIERYATRGKRTFFEDELIQTWILYHLQILGEAARAMSAEIRERYSDLNWRGVIDFRNLAVHEYFRVDLQIVWRIVESDLPLLRSRVEQMLNAEGLD